MNVLFQLYISNQSDANSYTNAVCTNTGFTANNLCSLSWRLGPHYFACYQDRRSIRIDSTINTIITDMQGESWLKSCCRLLHKERRNTTRCVLAQHHSKIFFYAPYTTL